MPREAHAESYYAATANADPVYPELLGEVTADVCVIGGGFSGISVALELAERGYDVALLEGRRIAWGASGRSGGQICTGFSSGMAKVMNWAGRDDARKLFDLAEEAKSIIRERVERHEIDCDLAWGYFHGADKPRQLEGLRRSQDLWANEFGYSDTQLAEDRTAAQRYVNSPSYIGGLYEGGAGHLHPLNYCLGLARAAEAAGVRIFEGSQVTRLDSGAAPAAHCARGSVKATTLVLCCNAYLGDLAPQLRAKIMPVGTYIAATEALGENRARTVIPGNLAVSDSNFVLNYYGLSRDKRMLFGGRVSYSTLVPPNLPRAMRRKMLAVFPQLHDVGFDYTWGGYVAITVERTPHIGRLGDHVYFAQGYSGQGVAMSGLAGRVIAEAVAGQAGRFDLFARLPHTTFPGGRLMRTPTLALAMLWFRLRDLL